MLTSTRFTGCTFDGLYSVFILHLLVCQAGVAIGNSDPLLLCSCDVFRALTSFSFLDDRAVKLGDVPWKRGEVRMWDCVLGGWRTVQGLCAGLIVALFVCCWSSNVKMPANGSNVTVKNGGDDTIVKGPITWDDATWILTSAFIIFTMQSGRYILQRHSVVTSS